MYRTLFEGAGFPFRGRLSRPPIRTDNDASWAFFFRPVAEESRKHQPKPNPTRGCVALRPGIFRQCVVVLFTFDVNAFVSFECCKGNNGVLVECERSVLPSWLLRFSCLPPPFYRRVFGMCVWPLMDSLARLVVFMQHPFVPNCCRHTYHILRTKYITIFSNLWAYSEGPPGCCVCVFFLCCCHW